MADALEWEWPSRRSAHALAGWAAAFVITASLFLPRAAAAQDAPPSPAALVEEVEVIARLPGPALWRVSTSTAQLWILGLDGPLPRDFQWDNRRVAAALDGARELVLPPVATGGLGDAVTFLVDPGHLVHLPPGETVRGGLPPEQARRLDAAARAIGRNPAHYDHWRPVLAAAALVGDGQRYYRLNGGGPLPAVAALAKSKGVRLRQLAAYKAHDLLRSLGDTPPEVAAACLALATATVERLPADAQRRAEAWATGDLKALKAIDAGSDSSACLDAAPPVAAFRDRAAEDWAKALAEALASPGKTVVAAGLDTLIRKGGLLDQLKAQGLEVIGPAY
jgi:uncharacterized protein YbaP (TraB family)